MYCSGVSYIVKPLIITQWINKDNILSVNTVSLYGQLKAQVSRTGMLLRWIKVESGYKLHILLEICWQEKRTFGGSCQKFFKTFGRLWDLSILNKWNNKFLNQDLRDITPPSPSPSQKKASLQSGKLNSFFS